jgi:hypothetical protein
MFLYVGQAGLEPVVLLSQPPKCWNCRHADVILFIMFLKNTHLYTDKKLELYIHLNWVWLHISQTHNISVSILL